MQSGFHSIALRSGVRATRPACSGRRLLSTVSVCGSSRSVPLARLAPASLRLLGSSSGTASALPPHRQQSIVSRRRYATEGQKEGEVSEEQSVQEAIKKVVEEYPCVIFMKGTPDAPQCGFSRATVQALNVAGANYEAFDVLQSPALREGIKKYTDWPTIPQVFIGGEFVGGCDITLQNLRSGELTKLLEKAKALKPSQQ